MTLPRVFTALALPVLVAACAQQEERPVIQGQLIFDKFGGPIGCDQGEYIPGAPNYLQCLPPDEACEDPAFSNNPFCRPPPGRQPNGGPDRTPGGQVPGAAPNPNNPNVPGRVP